MFAQTENLSCRYREGLRSIANKRLPLSGLVGFSIWKVLRNILPNKQKFPQRLIYAGNINDGKVLDLLSSSLPKQSSPKITNEVLSSLLPETFPVTKKPALKRQQKANPIPVNPTRKSDRVKEKSGNRVHRQGKPA